MGATGAAEVAPETEAAVRVQLQPLISKKKLVTLRKTQMRQKKLRQGKRLITVMLALKLLMICKICLRPEDLMARVNF